MQSFDSHTGLYIYSFLNLHTNTTIAAAVYKHMVKRIVMKKENKKKEKKMKKKMEENELTILHQCRSLEMEWEYLNEFV